MLDAKGRRASATCMLTLLAACSAPTSLNTGSVPIPMAPDFGHTVILTDQALADYASRKGSLTHSHTRRVLGVHNGTQVVEQLFCGDLCPLNTIRVIYYDLPKARRCDEAGGKNTEVRLPKIASPYKTFCIPSILILAQGIGEDLIVR